MEKLCTYCGAFLDDTEYCPKCGEKIIAENYGITIKPTTRGSGLILFYNDKPHSEIKDTNKYRDTICEQLQIPRRSEEHTF